MTRPSVLNNIERSVVLVVLSLPDELDAIAVALLLHVLNRLNSWIDA